MSIHILCLNILLLFATCYPTAIPQIFLPYIARYAGKKSNTIYLFGCNVLYVILILMSLTVVSVPMWNIKLSAIWWIGAAIVLGGCLIPLEYGVGKLVMLMEGKKTKGFSVNTSWQDASYVTFILTILLAVFEEIVFREVWGTILITQFKLPILLFIVLSAFFYAINHLYYGIETFIQKLITGIIFTLLFLLSGKNIIVPMLAHVVQNIILLVMGRSRKGE